MKRTIIFALIALSSAALSGTLEAQRQGGAPQIVASGRAATAVCLTTQCRMMDTSTLSILVEYGQPHRRGREVFGTLVPFNGVWRMGANTATHLFTRVPITLGGTRIPAGKYTLHLAATATGADLVINNSTDIWGVPYPGAASDRARVPMRSRTLSEDVESLVITLVPSATAPNTGVLSIIWGKREHTVDWTAQVGGAAPSSPHFQQ